VVRGLRLAVLALAHYQDLALGGGAHQAGDVATRYREWPPEEGQTVVADSAHLEGWPEQQVTRRERH
jgi:hypothetical protein